MKKRCGMRKRSFVYIGVAVIFIAFLLFLRSRPQNRTPFLLREILPEQETVPSPREMEMLSSLAGAFEKKEVLPEQESVGNYVPGKIVLVGETLPEQEGLPL